MIQHFIITKFSYRRVNYQKDIMPDPLKSSTLKKRFRVFEMITLPAIKAQENKNFTWIIVVDPKLPHKYHKKFNKATATLQNVFLINNTKEVADNSLTWLEVYIDPNTEYVITSILDADDGVYKGFTKDVHEYYAQSGLKQQLQPLHFLSCRKVVQWDFYSTKNAPIGFLKPWTRMETSTIATGLTVCCKYPEMDFSVMGFGHRLVGFIFNEGHSKLMTGADKLNVEELKHTIRDKASNSKINWDGILSKKLNYGELEGGDPQIVMPNNFLNVRFVRIFESPDKRKIFHEQSSIPGIGIDYKLVVKRIRSNRKSVFLLIRILWMFLFEKNHVNINKKKSKYARVEGIIKGFRNM